MDNILRLPAVQQRVGLSRSQIYELVRQGRFPPPVKLSERASGWSELSVSHWVDAKLSQAAKAAA
jgi:prophage regulatory protein